MNAYGWLPDLPDHRDRRLSLLVPAELPPAVNLRNRVGVPVYDQGASGSCTAQAIAALMEYLYHRPSPNPGAMSNAQLDALTGTPEQHPSRLFLYYASRDLEGLAGVDHGAFLRDGFKVIAKIGVCSEADWPFDLGRVLDRPPDQAYSDATLFESLAYHRVDQDEDSLKACLASGLPFVGGFTVYESFESASVTASGVVPMPSATERVLGGHAVLFCGYFDGEQRFTFRNSWGEGWGDHGHGYLPYRYLTDTGLAADFWTVTT